jgi:hypothetical protein
MAVKSLGLDELSPFDPNKKIIAPSKWFAHRGPNPSDIYESYWIQIPCDVQDGLIKPIKNN